MRSRCLALAFGAALAVAAAFAAEWVCGVLFRINGPRQRVRPAACARGAAETRHGIVPLPPAPVPRVGPDPAAPYSPDQIEDLRLPSDVGGPLGPGLLRVPLKSFRFVRRFKDGKVVWDVPCVIDRFGRRDTPGEAGKARAERFILTLGDSFVFGDCVGQDETMAAAIGRRLPWARVYNYGLSGLFPGELLERVRLIRGAPEIREPRGTVLYFFSDTTLRRNMYSLLSVGGWGNSRPYYHEDGRGRIAAEQYTKDARPVWTFLARLFVRSSVMGYLSLDYPLYPAESDLRFMVKMIAQTRDETRRFGADQFYVVLYPGAALGRVLIPYLEKDGIDYIDLTCWNLIWSRITRGPAFIAGEGHPTPETHRLLGEALADVLSAQRPRRGT